MDDPRRSGVTNIVGLFFGYLPGPLEPFPSLMVNGMLARLFQYRKNLLVMGQPFSNEPDDIYHSLVNSPIDGLIFIPSYREVNARLIQSGLPVVAVADQAEGIVSVGVDDEMGALMLAEHLAIRGHRKVLFRKDLFNHESGVRRFQAFHEAAKYLGMEVIATTPADAQANLTPEEEGYLLGRGTNHPTAAVAWADSYAAPVLKFCKAHGINIPKDLAIAGFDAIQVPSGTGNRLTSVHAPWLRVAERAVDLLMQMLRGETVPQDTVLPVDLLIGDTT